MIEYQPHEIQYAWDVGPHELEAKIKDGWALISISPYHRGDGPCMVAVLRRKIPQGDDQGSES